MINNKQSGKNNNFYGHKHIEKSKRKMSEAHLGIKASEKTKKKMSEIHKKNGTGKWMIGRKRTKKTRRKMSIASKGKPKSQEHKRKISEAKIGTKNPNWNNGSSFEPYSVDWTKTLKRSIRERDHYTCQICKKYGYPVHHIDYDKTNCNPDNLITLCKSCHSKTNNNRKYWINYFNGNTNPKT